MRQHRLRLVLGALAVVLSLTLFVPVNRAADGDDARGYTLHSAQSGPWSEAATWVEKRVPKAGDRILIAPKMTVTYDAKRDDVIRSIHVAGVLTFARDRDTELNVGVIKIQPIDGDHDEHGDGDTDAAGVDDVHEHHAPAAGSEAAMIVGTSEEPIPAGHTARIRLHYIEGMKQENTPAIVCRPGGRMEYHGAEMNRTWVKLGHDVKVDDATVELAEAVTGWNVGDEVIVTGSVHEYNHGTFRNADEYVGTEQRTITKIDGTTLTLNAPLKEPHAGSGQFRSEVANLSRNVIVESADPKGVRGHTMFHRYSRGSISYARFAHLGKEATLGRYPIHFHQVKDTMRGSSVIGAAIVDSGNRWVTIHGTQYMVVRDCVGYQSVGHGFFLEDGTEEYNVLDRNLGVQAYKGKSMRGQALPFDPNDGAAYWWANGRNTFIRNVAVENDEYGFRYDSQKRSNFNSFLPVRMPDGSEETVDIRTIPVYRFQGNEVHTAGLYSIVFAGTDGVGPDTRHPHVIRDTLIWQTHYAIRTQIPTMLVENLTIDHAQYGVYRPWYRDHVYRNVTISNTDNEPFNRGQDDDSAQEGSITVDGLAFTAGRRARGGIPYIQISDNNPTGKAETHMRNVSAPPLANENESRGAKALVDRGGGSVVKPTTPTGVPVYLHDYYGPGRTAKVVSTASNDFGKDGLQYRQDRPLTGRDSAVAEVTGVDFPKLLDPVDDQPPATIVTWPLSGTVIDVKDGKLTIAGTTTDNEKTQRVVINGVEATNVDYDFARWRVTLNDVKAGKLTIKAFAVDAAGNQEKTPHELTVTVKCECDE